MRSLAGSICCAIVTLVPAAMPAAPAPAQVIELKRQVRSGVDSLVAWARGWDRNCKTLLVTVTITRQPANGTVSVVPGVASTIPQTEPSSGEARGCAGKPVTGNQIRYKSQCRLSRDRLGDLHGRHTAEPAARDHHRRQVTDDTRWVPAFAATNGGQSAAPTD